MTRALLATLAYLAAILIPALALLDAALTILVRMP